jgi:zinc transport system permease protein
MRKSQAKSLNAFFTWKKVAYIHKRPRMIDTIITSFSIPVIRYAFFGMLVAGSTLSLLGVIIVSLQLTAIRFTLMHVGLLGAAAGLSLGFSPMLGAFILVVCTSLIMGRLGKDRSLTASSISGLFMTGSLAGAFILLATAGVPAMNVFDIFAGNILLMTKGDLIFVVGLGVGILVVFWVAYREIQLVLLDKDLARTLGVPVDLIVMGMFLLLGVGVATALRLVGALLVDAIILLPGIAALRLARNFRTALIFSSLFGTLACIGGFMLALFLNLPIGASTAMVSTILLAATMLFTKTNH